MEPNYPEVEDRMGFVRGRSGRRVFAACFGILLSLYPVAAKCIPQIDTGAPPDSALTLALARIEGASLVLTDAIRMGLESASSVREAREAYRAAREAVRRERGAFDPSIFAELSRTSDDRATASAFSGAPVLKTRETGGAAGARLRLPIGTDLAATLNAQKTTTNSSFASLNPQYDAFAGFTVTQPLLKGFGPSAYKEMTAAEAMRDAAGAGYLDSALAARAEIESTYWDLYAAGRDLAVQQLILDQGRALLKETRIRATAGLVGPSATASARVFVAEQEQALLDREEDLDRISDRLASLIGVRPTAGQKRWRPSDSPPAAIDVLAADSLVAIAIRRNPGLAALRAGAESVRAYERGAAWDALPQVDLVGSIGGSGLSGEGREVIFGSDTLRTESKGRLGESLRQVRSRDYPNWSAGVRFSMPILLRGERGERDRLRAEKRRADEVTIAGERALEERVRAAQRALVNAGQRMAAAREGVDASQEQARIGLIEYRNGRSTAFEIVRLGADLASAQQRYSRALVRAAQAAAEIRYLTAEDLPVLESE
jgi:outer membrane protein TolC